MNATAPLPQLSHDQLQSECYQWFRGEFRTQKRLMHANIGNSKNKVQGNQRKAIGVVAGVLDLEYFRKGTLYFFDIKVDKDKLSDNQLDFIAKIEAEGAKCYEIRSLEQFQTIIREINKCHN